MWIYCRTAGYLTCRLTEKKEEYFLFLFFFKSAADRLKQISKSTDGEPSRDVVQTV